MCVEAHVVVTDTLVARTHHDTQGNEIELTCPRANRLAKYAMTRQSDKAARVPSGMIDRFMLAMMQTETGPP